MRKLTIDPKYTRTYKTEENLNKALEKLNLPDGIAYLLVKVEERFTAVFTNLASSGNGMYIGHLAHKGFKVVG